MAVKIGALLEKLFKKASIDTTTEELKPLFQIDTEVADEFANKVDSSLLTLEAAKANPEINRLLKKGHYDAVDKKLTDIIKSFGITPDESFDKQENTFGKLEVLSKDLIEAGRKKAEGANKDGVHETLRKQAEEFAVKESGYQKQLKEAAEAFEKTKKEFESTREADLEHFEVSKLLLNKDYVFPKDMPVNVKVDTAYGTLKNELSKNGFKLKRTEAGQLEIVDKEGNPAYDDKHNKITDTNSWMDGVLAKNKLLKINDDTQHDDSSTGGNGIRIPKSGNQKNSAVINELGAQLVSLPD